MSGEKVSGRIQPWPLKVRSCHSLEGADDNQKSSQLEAGNPEEIRTAYLPI
jgi:hypothetical protein